MIYCPYCASGLWFDKRGEARCPSSVAFSVDVASRLNAYVRTRPSTRAGPATVDTAGNWHCPECGCRMGSDPEVSCPRCGRRLRPLIYSLVKLNPHQPWPPTAIESRNLLRSYWITFHDKRTFPQIGVTGRSIVDAFTILITRVIAHRLTTRPQSSRMFDCRTSTPTTSFQHRADRVSRHLVSLRRDRTERRRARPLT